MTVFVDTSALFALVSVRDLNHERAVAQWRAWLETPVDLVLSNYVLVETTALIQNRLGMRALQDFNDIVLPIMEVYWITQAIHARASAMLITAGRRQLSLVDCSSFIVMQDLGVTTAFAFDQHFIEQGFTVLPTRV